MGPTACGKSDLGITLRSYLPIELISVDSALIYRGMDIGTSKPNHCTLLQHPHRLLNIKDPSESYSVAEFQKNVLKEIRNIAHMGRIPCLVGGTMFYYQVLLNGLSDLPKSNASIRQYILKKNTSIDYLHKQLKLIDPVSAARIHQNDEQRLLRALEIFYISGQTVTELTKNNNYIFPYTVFPFFIMPPNKDWLYNRIQIRLNKMLILGFQKEVENLFYRGDLHLNLPSMRCIGYRQIWEYLEYNINYTEMYHKIIYATRKLAKHQLTWLNKLQSLYILPAQNSHILSKIILYTVKKNINKHF